jgi:uncharacterized protein
VDTESDAAAVIGAYPSAHIDHDNVPFYRGLLQRRYLVWYCRACDRWYTPPRPLCPRCWSAEVGAREVSGRATVHMMTVVRQAAIRWNVAGADPTSAVSLVTAELPEQAELRVTLETSGAGGDGLRIGDPVEIGWIDLDGVPYPVFVAPAVSGSGSEPHA